MAEDNPVLHVCEICLKEVETDSFEAEIQLENEWYVSLLRDICPKCRNTERGQHLIQNDFELKQTMLARRALAR